MIDKSWKTCFRQVLRNENYQKFALDTVCGLYVVYQLVVTCKLKMYYVSTLTIVLILVAETICLGDKVEILRPRDC